jgi:DNA-binding SARP family transcriptional activator
VEFRILGPLEVVDERGRLPIEASKQRALLALLLLHRNEVVSAERLIDQLWGDRPPKTARKTLQMHVSHLRRALGPEVVVTQAPGYVLSIEPGHLDLDRFEGLVEEARSAPPATAGALLRDALALWRGPALADLEYEPFVQGEIARLEELRLAALEDRIDADHALGQHVKSVGELEALAVAHPLRERIRGQLMLALYRSGRQAEALESYREARLALVEELGIEPGRELRDLEQAILRQEESLELVAPAPAELEGPVRGAGTFVGRERELAELLVRLDDARGARGGVVLVAGEPGIGKTRLAGEFASRAREQGARVLTGRCWEAGGAPAYWPWVQSLRAYLRGTGAEAVRAQLGTAGPVIAQMLPELHELVPDLPPAPSLESEGARFRLFDATAAFLRNAAGATPLVLVLDDLQAADTPSLLLLQFLAGQVADARILIVGAYRDVELRRDHPLRSTLAELSRHDTTRRLTLSGLTELDVSRFIALTTEVDSAEALAAAIHDQTEGNPLFVDEVVRLLAAQGRLGDLEDTGRPAIPPTVSEVIAQRLAYLPEACTDLLMDAAVVGREFSLITLGRIGGDEPLEVLDPALATHVVVEVPEARGRLRFSHGLVRDRRRRQGAGLRDRGRRSGWRLAGLRGGGAPVPNGPGAAGRARSRRRAGPLRSPPRRGRRADAGGRRRPGQGELLARGRDRPGRAVARAACPRGARVRREVRLVARGKRWPRRVAARGAPPGRGSRRQRGAGAVAGAARRGVSRSALPRSGGRAQP